MDFGNAEDSMRKALKFVLIWFAVLFALIGAGALWLVWALLS